MTEKELQAIRERAEAATEGHWLEGPATIHLTHGSALAAYSAKREDGWVVAYTEKEADAEFIAAARQDVPKLLAEVERLRARLDKAEGLLASSNTEDINGMYAVSRYFEEEEGDE